MSNERLDRPPTIRDLMLAKQDEMEASLSANRRIMPHEGEKGAAAELRWREMLSSYLPRRYSVRNGFVVDHVGAVSEQIDVIVHDAQYSPFLFQAGTSCFVPAESVYAIFDAKQEISKKTLEEAGKKVASVRGLYRTSGRVWTNTGPCDGKRPEDQPILGGILAVTCTWAEPFGDSFRGVLGSMPEDHRLHLGVAISAGAFELRSKDGREMILYDRNTALVGFFMALIRKLQPLATALAMDLNIWSKELREEE
ncbi:MAG: DUF6602 domain-containing protein [Gammaproteobacteria bacterium]